MSTSTGWPVEPPASPWVFSPAEAMAADDDLVALGADLAPGTVLAAYRAGFFPMGVGEHGGPPLGWWSPVERGVLDPARVRVSRSLRRSMRGFRITADVDFSAVVLACADPARPGRWITRDIHDAYLELHRLGWAHSIEVWGAGGDLVGGLYGLCLGGLFAGESMFHRATDASKAALVALCEVLTEGRENGGEGTPGDESGGEPGGDGSAPAGAGALIDTQWSTDHLASLGVVEIPRSAYLAALPGLTRAPAPARFRSLRRGHGLREPGATPPR